MKQHTNNHRKSKIIEARLQWRFGMIFISTAAVGVLVQTMISGYVLTQLARELPVDGLLVADRLPEILGATSLMTFAILVPLTLAVGVLSMFRVVGPIYRFRMYLTELIRGESNGPCEIREGDYLGDFCDLLNEAVAKLQSDARGNSEPEEQAPAEAA